MVALVDGDEIFVKGMKTLFDERNIPLNQVVSDYNLPSDIYSKISVLIGDPYKSDKFNVSTIKRVIENSPTTKVIVITSIANKSKVDEVIDMGVNAVLFKCCKLDEFINAYFKAIKGESHYCSSIQSDKCYDEKLVDLTEREVEIVELICKGNTTAEIADTLCRSTHTINSHRKNILKKLNIKTPLELLKLLSE